MTAALSVQNKNVEAYIKIVFSSYDFNESCLQLVEKSRLLEKGFSFP